MTTPTPPAAASGTSSGGSRPSPEHLEHPEQPARDPYTGVVIIHGLGIERQSEQLQEALNALTYWFNHRTGLALREEGAGRIWLDTKLSDDNDPDAPSSRATLVLVPPAQGGDAAATPPALRMEWREVWWAASFGIQSVGKVFRWAWVQYRQQTYVFAPVLVRVTPVRRRQGSAADRSDPSASASGPYSPRQGAGQHNRRSFRRGYIALYDRVEAAWKLAQWLIGMPLAFVLLALIAVVRLLAVIPGVARFAQGAAGLANLVLLHWISSMQAYLLDYVRASSMRQRFEDELVPFLEDPQCERIVVLAYSMGTVISYEALSTVLNRPEYQNPPKPITYVCLAQALGRIWRLARTDPHRIRLPLPAYVRWIHFWARYDPIVAGALDARALPPARDWSDPEESSPDDAMCASLGRCDNRVVVNRDSLLFDHTTYWQNLEQVVGPVARELVAGHAALEALVEGHLSTEEEVLRRRVRIAWRMGLAMLLGAIAGVVTLTLAIIYHLGPTTRGTIASLVGSLLSGGGLLPGFLGLIWQLFGQQVGRVAGALVGLAISLMGSPNYADAVTGLTRVTDVLIIATATVLATALTVLAVEEAVAERTPLKFSLDDQRQRWRRRRNAGSKARQRQPNDPAAN